VTEGKWTSYVATAVDEHGEGSSDQSFFPRQWGTGFDRKFLYSQSLKQCWQDMGN